MLGKHDLLVPRSTDTFQLEVGNLSAEESVFKIIKYLSMNSESWNIDTEDHFHFV